MYQTGVISPPAERVALSIGRIGPSLMLSALSETLAFSLGTLVGMPAVKSFSMIAAMAVWIDFCLQITCFVAILTLDARRAEVKH
jgi:Niemann-Pick C1 protein